MPVERLDSMANMKYGFVSVNQQCADDDDDDDDDDDERQRQISAPVSSSGAASAIIAWKPHFCNVVSQWVAIRIMPPNMT